MNKNVVVLGGGTGQSFLLKGLKKLPLNITTVVSVSDSGQSTGRLRKEFNIPAVGDLRKVLVALSETEPLFEELLNYRFETTSDLNGHTVGNLLLTAMVNIKGTLSDGIESISKVLNLKGKILPLTEDNVTLVGKMTTGETVIGEHKITEDKRTIKEVSYLEEPTVNLKVLDAIKEADLVILSMGSLYTSVIPNLLCKEVIDELDKNQTKIMYICNMFTQPGETTGFKVSDHLNLLNSYLGKNKISVILANDGNISLEMVKKYANTEQKDPVILDSENIDVELITDDFASIEDGYIRHDSLKVSLHILKYLL